MSTPTRRSRRAFALYVVLIVLTIAALMATSVVYAAQAQRAAADAASRRVQSRALAWSGVQAAMEELRTQRDGLICGAEPQLPEDWTMFTDGSRERATARLVADASGRLISSESGKLDINTATEAMLAHVPGLDADIAKRIVAARASRKFMSVTELAGIEGLQHAFDNPIDQPDAAPSVDAFVPPEPAAPSSALTDFLTVFSFEPNVQSGLGRNAESHTGVRRISLSGKWSDRLGRAITERFDENAANVVKSLMEQGTKLEKESDIVKVLRRFNVEAKDWAEVLDAFCGDPGPFRLGRVDVLNAPQEVLACIPGVDAAAAEQIVLRRGKLAPEQRLSLVWLVTENILTPDQFEQAIDSLGTRSMQWRLVIEAGLLEADPVEPSEHPDMHDRVLLEVVLDVSSERPRVAYLRETTMVEAARTLGPLRPAAREKKEEPATITAASPPGPTVSSVPTGSSGSRRSGDRQPKPPASGRGSEGAPAGQPTAEEPATPASEKDPRLGRWTPGQQ